MPKRLLIGLSLVAITAVITAGGWALTSAVSEKPAPPPAQFAPGEQTEPGEAQAATPATGGPSAAPSQQGTAGVAVQTDVSRQDAEQLREAGADAIDRNLDAARAGQLETAEENADRMRAQHDLAAKAHAERLRQGQVQAAPPNPGSAAAPNQASGAPASSAARPPAQSSPAQSSPVPSAPSQSVASPPTPPPPPPATGRDNDDDD